MSEGQNSKPKTLWDTALRAVKGDNTMQLVEQFTAEMTLVAEGLAEDQSRLHQELNRLQKEQDQNAQRVQSAVDALEHSLQESERRLETRLDQLSEQVNALDKKQRALLEKPAKPEPSRIKQLTLLVGMVCATVVLVAVLRLFG